MEVIQRRRRKKVEAGMRICVADGEISIDSVARFFDLDLGTPQRRLAAGGVTDQVILDIMRRRRASERIAEKSVPLNRISTLPGYSDAAHFTRGYRRWHGHPPNRDRNGHAESS